MPLVVGEMFVGVDPRGDFRFDGLSEHPLESRADKVRQQPALKSQGWKLNRVAGTFSHGSVLLGVSSIRKTKSNPSTLPENPKFSSTEFGYISGPKCPLISHSVETQP